jgi:hypothetical protein
MSESKKKPDPPPERTLEVPAFNPALDSAARPPKPPADTYPLLDLDAPPPPPAEPTPEQTLEVPQLSENPARRKTP